MKDPKGMKTKLVRLTPAQVAGIVKGLVLLGEDEINISRKEDDRFQITTSGSGQQTN